MFRSRFSATGCFFEEALEILIDRFGLTEIQAQAVLGQAKQREPSCWPNWEHSTVDENGTLRLARKDLRVQCRYVPIRERQPVTSPDQFDLTVTILALDPPWPDA